MIDDGMDDEHVQYRTYRVETRVETAEPVSLTSRA